ncbi:hypothetical protein ACIP98_19265 [Streptomyces sp. NPDC088354]|uniref:hypothetical protein n=1 Tax=Streptomyces sp. NPDC088354 TaxID=3365856 RepID=UPI0038142E51
MAGHEIGMAADPHGLSAMLVGPLLYHATMRAGSVSPRLIEQLIDSLGEWHGTPSAPAGPGQP